MPMLGHLFRPVELYALRQILAVVPAYQHLIEHGRDFLVGKTILVNRVARIVGIAAHFQTPLKPEQHKSIR